MGKLNWTVLTGLAGGCAARDLTVSMTFRHLATVVEMVAWSLLVGLDVAGVVDGGVGVTTAVVTDCKGLQEIRGKDAAGWPIKGRTA